jgi:phosphodiesterase/alkaline phosphatase D-like protein
MTELILGPLLRRVGETHASIWVETGAPCSVEIRAGAATASEPTFTVAGHHYAIVVVTGLTPGSATPYEVRIDGTPVWPPATSTRPPSRIRTVDPERPVRLLFGSCREPEDPNGSHRGIDPDVLIAYADRMATQDPADWPDALYLVGDQVYADDTSTELRAFIRSRRDPRQPPRLEVADFEEYTRLYRESWLQPTIRWLFSTLSTSMMFDDHDIRDDWNTSDAWRRDMQATSWWDERITGGLMSYWIYQHLGNLDPAELAADDVFQGVRAAEDGESILRAFARHADAEADGAKGTRWSYRRDFGRVRTLVIDSRCGRILADGHRSMISEPEFAWIESEVEDGAYDHLVVATSMPWLLPRALHEIESWDEVLAGSPHRLIARAGEWARRSADLEHWAAFRGSFDRLARLFGRIGRGEHGADPPATICVLSGDVHHSYVAEAHYPERTASRVYQVTCSPFNNTIPRAMRLVFHVGWSKTVEVVMKGISRWSGVPSLPIHWTHPTGPHFGNEIGMVAFDGRSGRVVLERSVPPGPDAGTTGGVVRLDVVTDLDLTGLRRRH